MKLCAVFSTTALLSLLAPAAYAATITFDDVEGGTSSGYTTLSDPFYVENYWVTSNGVSLGAGIGLGLDGPDGSNLDRFSNNGTKSLSFAGFSNFAFTDNESLTFEPAFTGYFHFNSIEIAEVFKDGDFADSYNATELTFTGVKRNGQRVSEVFNLDGVSDGPGGNNDFETFVPTENFEDLVSLTIAPDRRNTRNYGYFLLDNMDVTNVPVPAALPLMAVGLGGLGLVGRSRRRSG